MSQSNYHRLANGTVYSYSTCIRQEMGALSIGNITRYSAATSRHQSQAQCVSCDVLLDNVPRGSLELLTLAVERGLVETGLRYNPLDYGMTTPFVQIVKESYHG